MGFSLLAPLFLAGLVALAAPIWIHLTARDRRDVQRFPSLKFLTRLPYRQMRRQRLRHPWLFALRALAVVLLVLAFCRPWVGRDGAAAADAGKEVVFALDRSYSMAYGDTWQRALRALRERVQSLGPTDRAALVTFADEAEVVAAATADTASILGLLETLQPGAGRTRFDPALRLADQLLGDSPVAEREVVLISDLQANAWQQRGGGRSATAPLAPGITLALEDLSTAVAMNVLITSVEVHSVVGDSGAQWLMDVRLENRSPEPLRDLPVAVTLEAEEVAQESIDLPAGGSATIRLGPIPQRDRPVPATVRIVGAPEEERRDPLTIDDSFHLVLAPAPPLPVLVIESASARADATTYLRRALGVPAGSALSGSSAEPELTGLPAFEILTRRVPQVRRADIEAAALVILHDSPWPDGDSGQALTEWLAAGGGVWMILGSRSASSLPQPMMASWREAVDRLDRQGASLASVDYHHPSLAIFGGAAGGNLAGPRFFRYRPITEPPAVSADSGDEGTVLARYTDGAVALAEYHHGNGRLLLWGSPLDNRWSNLPLQPVFLPFVHQVCRYLGGRQAMRSWYPAGQRVDLDAALAAVPPTAEGAESSPRVLISPSGRRATIDPSGEATFARLSEAGFYELRSEGDGVEATLQLAVNVDRAESDLTPLDGAAFVAASTAVPSPHSATGDGAARSAPTAAERERGQSAWWFLAVAATVLLVVESLWSNRRAQAHPGPTVRPAVEGAAVAALRRERGRV
ncbi:MAG: BatA and WFA domain-containing protein [Acidobacteriota bacterium]